MSGRPLYSIGAVARMLDIPAATLRTWEERYGAPKPERSAGGHRLYSRDQVGQLRFIKAQLATGMAPADAHRLLAERLAAGSPFAGEPEPAKTRLLVLLAERDPFAAELSEYFLRTEGYEVASARDATDAARMFEELTPSVSVVDLLISGGGGLGLCYQLKQHSDAPVLAISTLETSDQALEAGADGFLQKPLDPLQLVSAVKDLLGTSAFLRPQSRRSQMTGGAPQRIPGGRLTSDSQRLDAVLGGGFPAHAINLVVGPPGSGKTILAQQYVFHNATVQRPAIYLTTVSEPLEKVLRYGQTMAFFDAGAVGRAIFYEDLGELLSAKGLGGVLGRIDQLLKEQRPGIIVIDSFKALQPYAGDQGEFRRFLHRLAGLLSAFPVTCLWIGEYDQAELSRAPEFAVADAIVQLSTERVGHREQRMLQVLKLRGSGFLSGGHAYRLSDAGMEVFPRLADPVDPSAYALPAQRISSGIAALDTMLADGYWPGATTVVAGPSGSGKTLMGLHFVVSGARRGEPGIIATLQENPTQLERVAQGFGWSLAEDGVELLYRSPVDLLVDRWIYELLDAADHRGAQRIVVDSLGDLAFAAGDEVRSREYLYSLVQRCSRLGVSLLMTLELPDLFQVTRLSELGVSHVSDNVVLLQYLRRQASVARTLTVLKTRGSLHEPQIREFTITSEGITLKDERGDERLGDR